MRSKTNAASASGSFRDPSGFVFSHLGQPYRQINHRYREEYDLLIGSGLYDELSERHLLIPHREVSLDPPEPELAYKVIEPEKIEFISYPYEWCFGQLKEAALLTLEIQRRSIARGISLKDASAFNVQFHHGSPILIDTLSFEALPEGEPWIAYRQFCQHFLAPLALMAYRDPRLNQWARIDIDGVPLGLASRLLPWRSRLSFSLLMHLHIHAGAQRRYADTVVAERRGGRRMGTQALMGLIASLEGAIRRLKWAPTGTPWGDYVCDHAYTEETLAAKRSMVSGWLDQLKPTKVWDLGANVGEFSRLATSRGIPTVAFDYDVGAVEKNYRQCRTEGEQALLPLVMDLTNPSPALGWANRERLSLRERGPADLVLALALIHHLAIGNNVPLEALADFLASLGRWLILEFVPKDDPQVQRLLANREDIFPEYHPKGFEVSFQRAFRIETVQDLPQSGRKLYLLESRTK